MSTTRNIEVDALEVESGYMCLRGHDDTRRMEHGFLIIGGKAFTEEEVKVIARRAAEAYRDSSAMPSEFFRALDGMVGKWIEGTPARIFTEEEHEAEFQRRAKAVVTEIFLSRQHFELSGGLPGMLIQPGDVEQIAARHGIQLH